MVHSQLPGAIAGPPQRSQSVKGIRQRAAGPCNWADRLNYLLVASLRSKPCVLRLKPAGLLQAVFPRMPGSMKSHDIVLTVSSHDLTCKRKCLWLSKGRSSCIHILTSDKDRGSFLFDDRAMLCHEALAGQAGRTEFFQWQGAHEATSCAKSTAEGHES